MSTGEAVFEAVCESLIDSLSSQFSITKEEADMIADPEWIIKNMVIRGHVIAFCAEPNGGKTTIMFHLAKQMHDSGYKVIYVNADISGGDAKSMFTKASEDGFELLLPDMKVGKSMQDVVDLLYSINDSGEDITMTVFIFDTLKKMTDVIQKSKSKELYKLFRSMSAKGATICCLCHTNKYKDSDDNPIYEGTSDLRSDVDELIFLIPEKHEDRSMTVSTNPDKVRGDFQPISYRISPDREVTLLNDYVDTGFHVQQSIDREKDLTVIEEIKNSIQVGKDKQTEIVEYCKQAGIGWRVSDRVLGKYRKGNSGGHDELWERETLFQNNAKKYKLIHIPQIDG